MFSHRKLWIGPIHFSLVRNDLMTQHLPTRRPIGGFLTWDRRWMCGTLRIWRYYFNLDVDMR